MLMRIRNLNGQAEKERLTKKLYITGVSNQRGCKNGGPSLTTRELSPVYHLPIFSIATVQGLEFERIQHSVQVPIHKT